MADELHHIKVNVLPDGRLDTLNAARYLGLSVKTMAIMRSNGSGPSYIKLGRVSYFKEDLDAWVAQAERVTSTAQERLTATAD